MSFLQKIIFAVLILFFSNLSFGQEQTFSFHHLTVDEGLTTAINNYIYKDSYGYVWLGSIDGLIKYDGNDFQIYSQNSDTKGSFLGNIISSTFFEDKKGNLWFTTENAIHQYHRATDSFEYWKLENVKGDTILTDYLAFHLDSENNLWVRTGLEGKGILHRFNIETKKDSIICPLQGLRQQVVLNEAGKVIKVLSSMLSKGVSGIEILEFPSMKRTRFFNKNNKNGMPELVVKNVFIDDQNIYWLACRQGLVRFDYGSSDKHFEIFNTFEGKEFDYFWDVEVAPDEQLFVSSNKYGLFLFDKKTKKFVQRFTHHEEVASSLNDNDVRNLYLDQDNNLWLAVWESGVDFLNLNKNKFHLEKHLRGISIETIFEDDSHNKWVSTKGKGIYVFDAKNNLEETIAYPNEVESFNSFFQKTDGKIWGIRTCLKFFD